MEYTPTEQDVLDLMKRTDFKNISKGEIIFDRPLSEIKDDYIVLDVDKKDIDNIDKKHIIKTKENRLDYQVLIHKKNMNKDYEKYIKHITSLDDIMLLYIRGV